MAVPKEVVSQLDGASTAFDGVITKTEKKIFDSAVELIKKLDVDPSGKIKTTTANLKLLSDIKTRLAQITSKDKAYLQGVKELAKSFDAIYRAQAQFYATNFAQKTLNDKAKAKYEAMKRVAVTTTIDGLTGAGLQTNVIDPLSKTLLRAVTSGAKYSDLVDELRNQLMTLEGSDGSLSKYAKTYATTALTQYAGQNNRLFTDDLGAEWFQYVGSEIETTREFCHHLTAKEYIHVSEIPDILKGKIEYDGEVHQCKMNPKTDLPYGLIEGTTPENFQVNVGGWNCRHQLVPVAKEAVPKELRAKFDSHTAEEIARQKAEEEKKQKIAELKAQLAQYEQWKDADTSGIASAVASGDIDALTQYIGNMHAIEQQLAKLDLLMNPKDAMQNFSIAELQAVQDAVAAKLAQFDAKGFSGQKLVEKLQFEADWVEQNKKYPTWQVAQQAYNKKLAEVQTDLALQSLQPEVQKLVMFKTKSKPYKALAAELVDAYQDGNVAKVQQLVGQMNAEVNRIQHRRNPSAKSTGFASESYAQARKDAATWCKSVQESSKTFKKETDDIFAGASAEEIEAQYGYTAGSGYMNRPLRGYDHSWSRSAFRGVGNVDWNNESPNGARHINALTRLIGRSSYSHDIWLQRGVDTNGMQGFLQTDNLSIGNIQSMIGQTFTDNAFHSCGAAKGTGFSYRFIENIYCPKGTKMLYLNGRSAFNGSENEMLIQRGTQFRLVKAEQKGGYIYLDFEVVAQPSF